MTALRNTGNRPPTHRAMTLAGLLALLSISPKSVSAQALQPDPERTTISGTVANAVTLAPIARALVSSNDNRYATLTDSAGHFEFDLEKETADTSAPMGGGPTSTGISARNLWLSARKPGYIPADQSGANAVPGQEVSLSLIPESLIVGRVTLSTADASTGVSLQLFVRQVRDGLPRWTPRGSARTNSAGEFRFADLPAGSYKLLTNESMDNDPVTSIPGAQVYGFPPVYYPGAPDFAAAANIELAAGQTFQANLSLTHHPYHSVKIPLNGEVNGGMNIQVSPQGHQGPGYSLGYNALEHRIEGSLPDGNYVVDAITYGEKASAGKVSLRVAGAPAEGPAMTPVPSSSIPLNVKEEFSDKSWSGFVTWSNGSRSFQLHGPRSYLQVRVDAADDFGQAVGASIRPPFGPNDDSLALESPPPGRYWLRLSSSRGYVAAATIGPVDLLHEPLVISPGSAAAPIEITMRDDFATVEAMVTGMTVQPAKAEGPDSNAWVYFIPLHDSPGQFQQMSVFPSEHVISPQIVPGGYRVLAFSHMQPNLPYRDPEAMKAYETKGQVVHLAAGQKTNLQLQIIPGDE